jgi:hypothetical protein
VENNFRGDSMSRKESPEEKRERLRQNELENNSLGSLNEGLKRSQNGNLTDFSGGMGWKGTGIVILILIAGLFIYGYFFS